MARIQASIILFTIALLALSGSYAQARNFISMPGSSDSPLLNQQSRTLALHEGETLTEFHFYIQDKVAGPNKTVFNVAEASVTPNSPTYFGRTQIIDHLMTADPEFDSPQVGRCQGIHVLDDLHETALTVNWNIIFTEGEYEGSTLTLLGRLVAYATYGELSIVAGTGKLLLARGIALKKTILQDPETMNMVMEYHLYVATPVV